MKRYNTIILTILIVAVALLTGCTIFDDDFGNTTPDKNSAVALNFVPQNLEAQLVGTRAVDAKVTEETALNDVHIFLFNQANGEQFYYHHLSSSANEDTKSEIINPWDDDYVDIHDAIVFVVANFEEGAINKDKAEDHDYTLAELQGSYAPSNHDITRLPVMGMPMVGSVELDFDQLRDTGSVAARQVDIKMYALLSRLDFIISLNSDETDITGTYPQMTLKEFGLYNVPKYINVAESNSNSNFNESDYFDQEVTYGPTISNKSGQIRISLYMFENKQGIHTDYSYPDGIEDHLQDKQRYKPLIAEEENLTEKATYFTFSANYIDFHGTSIDVSYKLYVGANNTNDFNIRRNHQYKSNISIVGIKTSDYGDIDGMEGSNTFDARVTISESQPFFLSMIQERALDAHFGVVPIDIYLASGSDKVRLEVVNDGVSRGMMKLHNIGRRATQEGDGKKQYFYNDMISNAASYGLSDDISNIGNTHRVYIYVDENISLKSRTGYINVYYNGASTPSTTLAIEQTGLVPVRVIDRETGNLQQVVFCESFEEYLDFYDPLQPYNSPNIFPGLPWASGGKAIGENARNNYNNGKKYTEKIISAYGITMSSLTLNGTPATAAAYCAHKNKRQSNNNVVNYKWCMPGIRQLEGVLTANYNRFAPIRDGEYYWSSAAGKKATWFGLSEADDDDRARATAAYIDSNGNIQYAPSDKNNQYEADGDYNGKAGGSALRTTKLRIRAIYQPDEGDVIDRIEYTDNATTNETNFITNYPQN